MMHWLNETEVKVVLVPQWSIHLRQLTHHDQLLWEEEVDNGTASHYSLYC